MPTILPIVWLLGAFFSYRALQRMSPAPVKGFQLGDAIISFFCPPLILVAFGMWLLIGELRSLVGRKS